jgi:hypothetical protein
VLQIITSTNSALAREAAMRNVGQAFTAEGGDFSLGAQRLQSLSYPPNAQAEATALASILDKLAEESNQIGSQIIRHPSILESLLPTLDQDEATKLVDSDALLHDFGLPALTP